MVKNEILYKSFQVILFKKMDSDNKNYEVINCPEDDEYRVYCDFCDKLCIERFYKNHHKSQTHTNIIRQKRIRTIFYFNSSFQ